MATYFFLFTISLSFFTLVALADKNGVANGVKTMKSTVDHETWKRSRVEQLKSDIEQLQDVTAVFMLIDKVTARKCERCFAIRLQLWCLGKSPVERISLLDKFNC